MAYLYTAFCFIFFGGHLPQTSGFRSAKEILVVSFATQPRAFIMSDCNIFYTPPGGGATAGSNAPGAFLVRIRKAIPGQIVLSDPQGLEFNPYFVENMAFASDSSPVVS